jgi:hypothetical protein
MSEASEQKGSDFVRDLGDAVRKNPLSAALIGMGVVWLFSRGRSEGVAGFVPHPAIDRIPNAANKAFQTARSSLQSGVDAIGEGASSASARLTESGTVALGRASDLGSEYAEAASDYVEELPAIGIAAFDTVRSNLTELFKTQPLALGAIGLAIGAGIAAALPATDMEAAHLGEARDTVKKQVSQFAQQQADRAVTVATSVVDAAAEEARKQDLTIDAAKSAAGEISEKVGRVVDAARTGVAEKAP